MRPKKKKNGQETADKNASPEAPPSEVPDNASPEAPPSAAPGTTDDKAEKPVKVMYPGLAPNEEGKATKKVKGIPTDFDSKKHLPLKRRDFEDETVWLLIKAENLEKKAKDYRQEAEDWKRLGSTTDRVKAKKLIAMQRRMADLKAQLAAQGIDVDALLGDDDDDDDDDGTD